MSIKDKVYDRSPVFLQNVLISAYGYRLKKVRYGSNFKKASQEISSVSYEEKGIKAFQNKRLRALLKHAEQHVPYYKKQFAENKINVNDICLDNFTSLLPVLEKGSVRSNTEEFYSWAHSGSEVVNSNTSGTSGAPLNIRVSKGAIQYNYAFFDLFLKQVELSEFDRSATFAGRVVVPADVDTPPFWRINHAMNTMMCSSYHLNDKTIPMYIEALEEWQTDYIDSYSSAIYQIANYIVSEDIVHRIILKGIVTSSETLTALQRDTIELAFGCKVFDQYGCAEMAVTAYQTTDARYFVNPYYSIVEVLDNSGNPVRPGESGSLVCTGLLNHAMPLIRYRIGDYVKTSEEDPIGVHWLYLDSIEGRADDVILTPEGNRIGRLDPVFKGLSGINEAQIVQTDLHTLVVNLVKGKGYDSEAELKEALQRRVGASMAISFNYVDKIPAQKNGKFRSVVSMVDKTI